MACCFHGHEAVHVKADRVSLTAIASSAGIVVVAIVWLLRLPSQNLQLTAAAALTGMATAVVIVAVRGTATLATVLLGMSVLLLPLNGVRRGGATASDLLLILAVAVGVLHSGLSRRRVAIPRQFAAGVGIFVAAGAAGSLGAQGVGVGHFARLLTTMLVAVVGIAVWRPTIEQVQSLAYAWLAGNTINILVALGTMSAQEGRRPAGLTTHPNALGLVSALSVAFAIFIYSTGRWRDRPIALVLAGLSLVGVVLSGSRAAVLASLAALVLRVLLSGRWRTAVTGAVCVAVAWKAINRYSSSLPENSALNRLLHRSNSVELSNAERLNHLRDSISALQAHPWTGNGFANAGSAHDVMLQVAVASGLIGLAGFTLACSPMISPLWARDTGPWRWVALPAVTFLVAALISNNLWDRYVWFSLALGMLAYIQTHELPNPADDYSVLPKHPPARLARQQVR